MYDVENDLVCTLNKINNTVRSKGYASLVTGTIITRLFLVII